MNFISFLLLTAMVAIAMEKCTARYLLVEIDNVPTPRECCEDSSVPEFCLGLCSPADATARQEKRLNVCSKYDTIIEKCFQSSGSNTQVIGTKLNERMAITAAGVAAAGGLAAGGAALIDVIGNIVERWGK